MKTEGISAPRLYENATCFVLLWVNEIRLSLPHFSITVKSLERREVEMILWGGTSLEAWSCELNKKEEPRKVSTAKE